MKQLYTKLLISILVLCSASQVHSQSVITISPNNSNISETVTLSITGQGNSFGQGVVGTTRVFLYNGTEMIRASQVTIFNQNSMNADFTFDYTNLPGVYDFYVADSLTISVIEPGVFTLNAATSAFSLTSITPNSANSGQVINVSISGQGASFGQGTSTTNVSLNNGSGNIYADQVSIVNSNSINVQFTLNNSTTIPGPYDVNVFNSIDGPAQIPSGFTINANPNVPSLTSITPVNADEGSSINVTISGQNTYFGQGTATTQVWFNQGSSTLYANSVVANSNTNLTAHFNIANGTALGLYDVNVSNNVDGNLSLGSSFTVNADATPPSLVNITPNTGNLGQTIQVTLSGQNTNFGQGTGTIAFSQGSSTLYSYSVNIISDTQIEATVNIPMNAALGSYDVTMSDSLDGNLILFAGFSIISCGNIDAYIANQACPNSPATISVVGGTAPYNLVIDGQPYSSSSSSFDYFAANPGAFQITSINDNFGCPVNLMDSLVIYTEFSGSLNFSDVCEGGTAIFTDSIISSSPITSVYYNYGDGNGGTLSNYTYNTSGAYAPVMHVTNADGCEIDITNSNLINANPLPQTDVLSGNGATCGLSNGAFQIEGTGSFNPYTYSINGPGGYTSTSEINSALNPGVYNVSITDANGCIGTSTVTVTNISQITNITGLVRTQLGDPAVNAVVNLISLDDTVGVLTVMAVATVDINGSYSFANLPEGNYLISANPDTSISTGTIKTYFGDQAVWYFGDTVNVTCSSQTTADITLIELGAGMNGNSSVGGTIYDISGINKTETLGDPIPGVEVMLYDNNATSVVAITNTNNAGAYLFTGVNVGNYSLLVDIPGLGLVSTYSFDVNANQTINNKDFFTDSINHSIDTLGIIVTSVRTIIKADNDAVVFPNPFSEQTTLKYTLQNNASVKVEVFNILGERIQTIENTNKVAGTYQTVFNAANLATGIYFINLNINGEQKVFKVIRGE